MKDQILDKLNITNVRNKGFTGKGVKIAIIDEGINSSNGKIEISGGYNFIDNSSDYSDTDGHGTAIASIIKSKDFGIATDAEIYCLKIKLKYDEASINMASEAVEWCIRNNIDIINMSFSFTGLENEVFEEKCKEAVDNGIVIVCGAGNNPFSQGLSMPANYSSTIAVNSLKFTDTILETSSFGKGVDFCCYGGEVTAYDLNGNITKVSGTSFASPCVVGIIALLKEQNSALTPREIYELLKENAVKIDNQSEKSLYYGYGLVKAFIVDSKYKRQEELELNDLKSNIYFPSTKINVKIGDTIDSNLQFLPNNNEPVGVSYKISNKNIATVTSDGFVTGRNIGTTSLIAIKDNYQVSVCDVEVINEENDSSDDEGNINIEDSINFKGLNVNELHKAGIKGKGIKIAYIGYGCIDSENINLKKRIDIVKDDTTTDANNFGTIYCSLISGKTIGIAPEAELYAVKCASKGGVITWNDGYKAIQWCIDNKMDIINFGFINPNDDKSQNLLKKCYDNNIISVVNVCGSFPNVSFMQESEYSLTVSYVTDQKKFIDDGSAKVAVKGNFVDCVAYGYGVQCINSEDKQVEYGIGEAPVAQYYCNIAMMQVMGILALLKQQDPSVNNAVKVRALLPEICESLYGGKNDKTGYGLIKAKILDKR